jgi:exopolysaccharide biosynthesis polyprenyl glycosylphosphotransferase
MAELHDAVLDRAGASTFTPSSPAPAGKGLKVALVAADLVAIVAAMAVAYALRLHGSGPDVRGTRSEHLVLAVVALPLWIVSFARSRLYSARFITRRIEEAKRLLHASTMAVAGMAAMGYVGKLEVSRAWLLLSFVLAIVVVWLEREVARSLFLRARQNGRLLRNVVIVGTDEDADELAGMLLDDPSLGYRVAGIVDRPNDVHEVFEVVHRTGAGSVLIAGTAPSAGLCTQLVRELVHHGIHVELASALRDVAIDRLTVRPLGRVPVVYIEPRRPAGWRSMAKRTFDVCGALFGLLLVAPLAVLVAVAVKVDSHGPVIFRQTRVGRSGGQFPVFKFRTMVVDAEARLAEVLGQNEADGPLFKVKDDPRVTRVGRLLRKTSLDELPQLLNVLRGDMSLVGPRPALPSELEAWNAHLYARLRVKPGITGMWQIHGRSDASFESYERLDLYYVDNWSLVTDLAIVAKTLPAVVFGRGAY